MAVPVLYLRREVMSGDHYTIEDVTDDEIQYIQDRNEAFYFDLEFPDTDTADE